MGLWLVLAGALAVFLFGPGGWVSALLLAAWAAAVCAASAAPLTI